MSGGGCGGRNLRTCCGRKDATFSDGYTKIFEERCSGNARSYLRTECSAFGHEPRPPLLLPPPHRMSNDARGWFCQGT